MAVHEVRLECDPSSAGRARSFVLDVCAAEGVEGELVEGAELMVSELVTNSVVHGCSEVGLSLTVTPEALVGAITDHGSRRLPELLEPSLWAESGRGLGIVTATASAWGVQLGPDGKTVWFELAPAGPAPERAPT